MSISVIRLDDRLVHGQVVVGWGNALGINRIVLVDDNVSETEWEQELYSMGVPESMTVDFTSVSVAKARLSEWASSEEKVILLVGDVAALELLCLESEEVREVNLGGLHRSGGRTERLPYIFLSDDEFARLKGLEQQSIRVTAQDLPATKPVALGDLA
jgi:mannose/fructose/N-acetylgalactosamine-specific phosphotransferase system component IIB